MGFDLELPANLADKLESAAHTRGEAPGSLVVLAVAEKLARIEHEQWLAETQKEPGSPAAEGTGAAPPDALGANPEQAEGELAGPAQRERSEDS